jgi:hypothetical protein
MSITEEVEAALERYAAPLPLTDRQAFIDEARAELARLAVIGPGSLARICREVQPKYIDQHVTGTGPRSAPAPKYARPNWGLSRRSRAEEKWRAE